MSKFDVGTVFGLEEISAVADLLVSQQALTRGPVVSSFEAAIQSVTKTQFAVASSSCTAAIRIGFQALGLQCRPRKVIAQVNSFWNTIAPLAEFGCPIVFVDVEADSLSICPERLSAALQDRSLDGSVLILTEFGGHPTDHVAIQALASRHNLTVVADCAHAMGTTYLGKPIGAWVDLSFYSFSTLKNICTLGEGGALCTNSSDLAETAVKLRETWPIGDYEPDESLCQPWLKALSEDELSMVRMYCRPGSALHSKVSGDISWGTNFKLSAVQATVGLHQLGRLTELNLKRRAIAGWYQDALRSTCYEPIMPREGAHSSWHLFNAIRDKADFPRVLRTLDSVSNALNFQNVNRYWPAFDLSAIRSQNQYRAESFPRYMSLFFGRLLSLPINPKMTQEDVTLIVKVLREVENG